MNRFDPHGDGLRAEQAAENALAAWEICATPSAEDEREYLDTVAQISAALCTDSVAATVPESLRRRLAASAHAYCDQSRSMAADVPSAEDRAGPNLDGPNLDGPSLSGARSPTAPQQAEAPPMGGAGMFIIGTVLGAAAALVISLLVAVREDLETGGSGWAAQREVLLAAGSDPMPWQPGKSLQHGTISGDVAWDGSTQKGFLRIQGLEPLPPEREYQLWIVDGDRPGSAPVDGGLFSLDSAAEQLVPIDAKIPVGHAQAFVITVEDRGGVVVSSQDVVVAIATPGD